MVSSVENSNLPAHSFQWKKIERRVFSKQQRITASLTTLFLVFKQVQVYSLYLSIATYIEKEGLPGFLCPTLKWRNFPGTPTGLDAFWDRWFRWRKTDEPFRFMAHILTSVQSKSSFDGSEKTLAKATSSKASVPKCLPNWPNWRGLSVAKTLYYLIFLSFFSFQSSCRKN